MTIKFMRLCQEDYEDGAKEVWLLMLKGKQETKCVCVWE